MAQRQYRPSFYLEDFIKKSSSSYKYWIVEDIIVFGLIFLKLFESDLGIHIFRTEEDNYQQFVGKVMIISAFVIWQIWSIFRNLRTRWYAGKLLRESVVLDAWRYVRRIRKYLILGILLILINVSLTVIVTFVEKYERSVPLIIFWFSSYISSMFIRIIYFFLLNRCNKTINYRGNWCIRYKSEL